LDEGSLIQLPESLLCLFAFCSGYLIPPVSKVTIATTHQCGLPRPKVPIIFHSSVFPMVRVVHGACLLLLVKAGATRLKFPWNFFAPGFVTFRPVFERVAGF
jgi:hypothetical protein